ncbi:DUF4625 domain-containing protein [Tamlana sp. 2_MG-2023]|uniref:DUF4625 domain-containing protein n=1 Tax=unclassified Tamlana TaxID=2614803 RepID=UPI0026E24201|nr:MULTISPECIES: DUF4625 domain-containing protein [unclassified Tamlana]MDO6760222.1 DUF4625 domain-containing protein [Tamlana sp. 2_MG-2023]MDO6790080.1 DUF4625 domain-containing protein [Tamlana sp. 1_MG-2023]
MKQLLKYNFAIILVLFLASCSSDDGVDKDEEKPTITVNYDDGFPQACEELKRGETYNFRALVTDNQALASYSLNIHNNFDHHTHDDQEGNCSLNPVKDPVNPLLIVENYSIDGGPTSYEINIAITIPNDVDTGDYHCAYSVTDQTGWQTRTSVDIKIVD